MTFRFLLPLTAASLLCLTAVPAHAQTAAIPAPASIRTDVGMPQDAGPHDAVSAIEWWYFNAFLTTESGHHYAVVGSFFRTGLTPQKKGHYLLYALTDLDTKTVVVNGSVLDRANVELLKSLIPLTAARRPDDPRPLQLLAALQKGQLPKPHRITDTAKITQTGGRFAISMGGSAFTQTSDDGRAWKATLADPKFSLSLDLTQQAGRPPMLVGGKGRTGLNRPEDMYYLSLTHADAAGTLTVNGKAEKVTGVGWIDRQWGSSWVVQDNGWDWFGLHLEDGSDLIIYRVKDNTTGRILRAEATLLRPNGTQSVDTAVTFTPSGAWKDPATKITYPASFTVALKTLGWTLHMTPTLPDQTIPVLGIGDAIWEGVVSVQGKDRAGAALAGRGYMELVGYRAGGRRP